MNCIEANRYPMCSPCMAGMREQCAFTNRPVNLDAAREAFPCIECAHCRRWSSPTFYCVGPHVRPDIVTGKAFMLLPTARLETDPKFFRAGWRPCGEEGIHWKQRDDKYTRTAVGSAASMYWPSASVWTAGIFVVLAATVGFVYFNGVPLCR